MSNLQKLYAKKQESMGFNAEVNRAVETTVSRIQNSLADGVKAHINSAEQRGSQSVAAAVQSILPVIQQVVSDSGRAVDDLKRMIQAVRIPDNADALNAIEQQISKIVMPKLDLSPVLAKLDELIEKAGEEKEEPKWVFTVNRDPITKLMDSVTAEPVEDES